MGGIRTNVARRIYNFAIHPRLENYSASQNDVTVIWLGVGVFVCSMLRVWQGLDFTDMGYWLTGYQQLYSYPQGIGEGLVNWLSYFIGHWVGVALGGGVLSYKLGYVLVVTVTAMLAYQVLADALGRSRTLAALVLLTALFVGKALGNWVGYNNLTALFYLAGAALLYWGLVRDRKFLVAVAGAVLGANVFVRFPNLLGVALISAIWLQALACRWSLRSTLVWSTWFLAGFVFGAAMIWTLIVLHGHEALYVNGLSWVIAMAADSGSHHAGTGLLKLFFIDQVLTLVFALPVIVIGVLSASWLSRQHPLLVSIAIGLFACLLIYVLNYFGNGYSDSSKWLMTGLCYVVLSIIVAREFRSNQSLALIGFIAGLTLVLVPLGSNNGIANAKFGMWLALPLVLMWLWRGVDFRFNKFSLEVDASRIFCLTIVLALLYQALSASWKFTYHDSEHRLAMTHSISHPLLVGAFTTAPRAKVVSDLLDAMQHFVKPGDELLAYNEIALVHFLTETRPWLGTPWPMLSSPEKIAFLLQEKEKSGGQLPIIVRATGDTASDNWPVDAEELDDSNRKVEIRRVFAKFELRHGYVRVWSNEFFEVLQPS